MFSPERAHPIMIFTGFFRQIRGFIFPILVAFGFQARSESGFFENRYTLMITIVFFLLSIGAGLLKWYFFLYDYKDGVLHIKSGVFIKQERFIKKERIQTVSYKANIFWRMMDLVTLQIETAGGYKEPEIDIEAVDRKKAEELREVLKKEFDQWSSQGTNGEFYREENEIDFQVNEASKNSETNSKQVACSEKGENHENGKAKTLKVGYKPLVLAGMTSSGIGVIFSFIAVIFGQGIALIPEDMMNRVFRVFQNIGGSVIISLIFMGFLLAWVISIIRFVISYGDFTIEKKEDEILIRRGLLEQKQVALKTHRIQGIRIVEGMFRQPFGYGSIHVEVAGGASKEEGFQTVIHPFIKNTEVYDFIKHIAPEREFINSVKKLPKRSLKKYLFRGLAPLFPLPIAFHYVPTNWPWLGMGIFPAAAILGYLRYKDGGYRIDGDHLVFRYRVMARTTVLLRRKQIQSFQIQTNFIQKMRNLTTPKASILTARGSAEFMVKDLTKEAGEELWRWYSKDV